MFQNALAFVRPALPYAIGVAAGVGVTLTVTHGIPAARQALAKRRAAKAVEETKKAA
jgi:hypothetical protein